MLLAVRRTLVPLVLALVATAAAHPAASSAAPSSSIALDPGLGPLHHKVSTRDAKAQAYFDQGMKLVFAFNHEAAIRSFQRAEELDPDLAMAHWGIALALGSNINRPMDADAQEAAYAEVQKALALKSKASVAERAYIDALASRYSASGQAGQQALQMAYKNAMQDLVRRYPNDADAAVLYAESLMVLRPSQWWTADGKPAEGTLDILNVLERALAQHPDHIGANHYYIHALEASPQPDKALPAAKRLEKLAPNAGHLLHMSAHVYSRMGNYPDAARVNEAAVRADEALARPGELSFYRIAYYAHNLHFLAVYNAAAGNSAHAIAAANKLYAHSEQWIKDVTQLDFFMVTPAMVLIQFERWDDILSLPEPPSEVPLTGAIWRFARTLAFAAKNQLPAAAIERAQFVNEAKALPKNIEFGNSSSGAVIAVARLYLEGRLALMRGDVADAIKWLRNAVIAEDALARDDPPAWYLSSRQALGVAMMRARDFGGAEKIYREDLQKNPESGRALFGLQTALAAQRRDREAGALQKRIDRAWRVADAKLGAAM
jgi:tetratricopeptide (TPR) repeat protein